MTLAVGFLPIVSLVTSAMLAAVSRRLGSVFGDWQAVVEVASTTPLKNCFFARK